VDVSCCRIRSCWRCRCCSLLTLLQHHGLCFECGAFSASFIERQDTRGD
jgi:hypothetical protein